LRSEKEEIYWELLVLRCKRREAGALEELIRNWERRLFYYVRRLAENEEDAWDILQETWLKVLRGIGSLREPRSLPTWLYRIARNTAVSRLRANRLHHDLLDGNQDLLCNDTEEEPFGFEDAQRVHHGLSRISMPHREVLTLHFLEDLSVEEIADVVGVPSGTVKSRLHYAKRALRTVLEKEG
jgi:RNA polymerase sigma factor (sigma-70 family)